MFLNAINRRFGCQFFYAPNDGGANGGGATATATAPTDTDKSNAGANGDAGASTAKTDDADPTANKDGEPNTEEPDPDAPEDKPTGETFTKEQVTAITKKAVDEAVARAAREQRKAERDKAAAAVGDDVAAKLTLKEGELADALAEVEELKTKLLEAEGQQATAVREKLMATVAAKHKLPPELAEVLKGDTEAELEAHAKKLSKVVGPPKTVTTEGGGGDRAGSNGTKPPAPKAGDKKDWNFNPPAGTGVAW